MPPGTAATPNDALLSLPGRSTQTKPEASEERARASYVERAGLRRSTFADCRSRVRASTNASPSGRGQHARVAGVRP